MRHVPHVTLPVDSPWALPPMLVLQSRTGGRASAALRRRVLHLKHLALSPAARRSVARGAASAGALRLLAAFPRTGGPLLVLALDGRHIRAQETTLWMTRTALRRIPAMPAKLRPKRLLLEPVATRSRSTSPARRAPSPASCGRSSTIYRNAGYQYGIDWRVLAAINRVETNFGQQHARLERRRGRLDAVPALDLAALGRRCLRRRRSPIPTTRRTRSSARRATSTRHGAREDIRRAVFAYNHADWYVNEVLTIAAAIPDDYGA